MCLHPGADMNPSRHVDFADEAAISEVSKNTLMTARGQMGHLRVVDGPWSYTLPGPTVSPYPDSFACLNVPSGQQMVGEPRNNTHT